MLDSVHFRRALAHAPRCTRRRAAVLRTAHRIAARPGAGPADRRRAKPAYSRPLAYAGLHQGADGRTRRPGGARASPRLKFGGAHLHDPEAQWAGDVAGASALARPRRRAGRGGAGGAARRVPDARRTAARGAALRRHRCRPHRHPWRVPRWPRFAVVCLIVGPMIALAGSYHVLGTDRTGNDVLLPGAARACAPPS